MALDTAGLACSVAVTVAGELAYTERFESTRGQAERLLPMVDRALSRAGLPPGALDFVAVTVGPGSFTGIRIGLAAARGIALATNARLIGVTSFEAVAATRAKHGRFLLVALESRREDLFVQLFDPQCDPIGEPAAIMPAGLDDVVNTVIGAVPLLVAGDAAQRAAAALSSRAAVTVLNESTPDAIGALRAALRRLHPREEHIAPRPVYLRSPGVTLAPKHRNPGLGPA